MTDPKAVQLKFWGTRGSTPTPVLENLKFGGNTSCISVRCGDQVMVFDAGSGVRNLGLALMAAPPNGKLNIDLFLTHFHWDHIQGIPFFRPLFVDDAELHFFCHSELGPLRERLEGQMARPYFPVGLERLRAPRTFCDFSGCIQRGAVKIYTFPLNHPQGAAGYRIECPSATIVYATDLEHGNPECDRTLRQHSEGADVLIYDAQYTPEEYEQVKGWGHSTWLEATNVARDAKVKRLILFHHDPARNDSQAAQLQENARRHFENTDAAAEASTIEWTAS